MHCHRNSVNRSYAANALNQCLTAGSATFAYDGNGNLTSDGTNSYGYDAENRLICASTSGGTTLTYDPLGRLYQTSSATFGSTQFAYDGVHVVAEYNGSTGAMRRRFFSGPGADEPILQDEGGQWDCTGSKFLHTDDLGSVIAAADCWGNRTNVNTYDEYGIPGASNWGRFQYTGQAFIPDLGMYYYKAWLYSPTLGRFMQTDPIGYGDGPNWYAYVHNNPINGTDPSGLDSPCQPNVSCVQLAVTGPPKIYSNVGQVTISAGGNGGGAGKGGKASETAVQELTVHAKPKPKKDPLHFIVRDFALCSADALFADLRKAGFSAPGAPYAKPGLNTGVRLADDNYIDQNVNVPSRTITNVTEKHHIFYKGSVVISVTPTWYGSDVNIEGPGTNSNPLIFALDAVGGDAIFTALSAGATISCTLGIN